MPDIEFSTVIEVWVINVFLNDIGSKAIVFVSLSTFYTKPDIFKIMTNADTWALITALSRFNYPNISCWIRVFQGLFLINLLETFPFRITGWSTDMESLRNDIEHIFIHFIVIIS